MFAIRLLKMASLALISAGTVAGVGLAAQTIATGDGPRAAPAIPAAPDDEVATIEVKVGRKGLALAERGSVEAVKIGEGVNPVEGLTTILSILTEGTQVKSGELICELDSAALRDRLINQQVATKQAEKSWEAARSDSEVAALAIREYDEGTFLQEHAALTNTIDLATLSIARATARRDRGQTAL